MCIDLLLHYADFNTVRENAQATPTPLKVTTETPSEREGALLNNVASIHGSFVNHAVRTQ